MRVGVRRIATVLALTLAGAMLPIGVANASPVAGASTKKLTHISFSTTVKQGHTYLHVAGNTKKAKLRIFEAAPHAKRKLSSCSTVTSCSMTLPSNVTRVYGVSGKYRSATYTVKLRKLTFTTIIQSGKRYLHVSGNVANVPAKTLLRIYNSGTKKLLAHCTTIIKCDIKLPDAVTHVYGVAGSYHSQSTKLGAASSSTASSDCGDLQLNYSCYPYKDFDHMKLTTTSTKILPPIYTSTRSDGKNGLFQAKYKGQVGVADDPGATVAPNAVTLTISGIPDYSEFHKYGLGLYLFEANDLDATIAADTIIGDGHLVYPEDLNGNPTFTIYDWDGSYSHTYIAAVGIENRNEGYKDPAGNRPQPTFAKFMSTPGTFGLPVFLSNPVTITPDRSTLSAKTITASDPIFHDAYAWVTSNYTNYQNVEPEQLSAASLLGIQEDKLQIWGDLYGNQAEAVKDYQANYEGQVPGLFNDPVTAPSGQELPPYPDVDATWDYVVKANQGDGWWTQFDDQNIDKPVYRDGMLYNSGWDLHGTIRFTIARWRGQVPVDAIYYGSADGQPGTGATVTSRPSCNPETETQRVGPNGWDMDQARYAVTDTLFGGALSAVDQGAGGGLVNQCSIEYKVGAAATKAAILSLLPEFAETGLLEESVAFEAELVTDTGVLSSGLIKLSNADPAVQKEGAVEIVKEFVKQEALKQAREHGCDVLAAYYAKHALPAGQLLQCSTKAEEK